MATQEFDLMERMYDDHDLWAEHDEMFSFLYNLV